MGNLTFQAQMRETKDQERREREREREGTWAKCISLVIAHKGHFYLVRNFQYLLFVKAWLHCNLVSWMRWGISIGIFWDLGHFRDQKAGNIDIAITLST